MHAKYKHFTVYTGILRLQCQVQT